MNTGKPSCEYPIYMHVNLLEKVFPSEELVVRCADAGYDGVELRGFDKSKQKTDMEYIQDIHKHVVKAGIGAVYGCPGKCLDPDSDVREKSLENLNNIVAFASDNGITVLNVFGETIKHPEAKYMDFHMNGSAAATDEQWDMTVDFFQRAGDFAADKNVKLCFETHMSYIHDVGDATAKLLDRIDRPSVMANLDYGNIFLTDQKMDMAKSIAPLLGRIGYTHLKNVRTYHKSFETNLFESVALYDGEINNFVLVCDLLKSGYKGIFTIENTMGGDKRYFMRTELAYLRELIADAQSWVAKQK